MAAADYRLLTEATGVRIAEALEDVTAMVGPKGDTGEVSEAELTAKLADKANVIVDTTSGAIAAFPDGMAAPAKDITIGIEPVQSGSGDPSPENVRPISGWTGANVTRTGFNVWDEEWELGTFDNNIWLPSTPGYVGAKNPIKIFGDTTYYSKCPVALVSYFYDGEGNYVLDITITPNSSFTTPSNAVLMRFRTYAAYGTTYNHDICINISDPAKNGTYEPGHVVTYPISWQSEAGTVYGGTLDVTTGLLTVTMAEVDLGTLNWIYESNYLYFKSTDLVNQYGALDSEQNHLISSIYVQGLASKLSDRTKDGIMVIAFHTTNHALNIRNLRYTDAATFKAAMSGVQLVYELATPQTYQLTPTEVTLLLGDNNVWADTGDSIVIYRADTKLYIQKINAPTDDDMIADAQIASGKYFIVGGNLYKSTTTIPAGDTINPGSNCILTNLADALNALNT